MNTASGRRRGNTTTKRGQRPSLLLVGFTLLVVLSAWATGSSKPIPPGQAEAAAVQFVVQERGQGSAYLRAVGALPTTQVVGPERPLLDPADGTTLGYVYDLDPVGYVAVTSDTRLAPVIAFSYESDFSWDENPNNILLHMLRRDLALRLGAANAEAILPEAAASNESDWEALVSPPVGPPSNGELSGDPPASGETTVYGPWLTSAWDQWSPWNDDCPIDPVTSDRCVVGCTATALAQVLNYWQYPTSVAFPASADYVTTTRSISIDASTADFTGLDYNERDPSNAAMADLSYAAGVSVEMDYTSTGSGAHMAHWSAALAGNWSPWSPPDQRWGYASADLRSYASEYSGWGSPYYTTETSFYEQLSTNMTQGRPAGVWVSASGGGGGHTIVADGWQSGGRTFHLNYGWGGSTDGWYVMPTGMGAGYGFVEAAVVNIYPTATAATFRVDASGNMLSDATVHAASFQTVAADVAEWVPVSEPVEPGDVVELDPLNPGSYRLSSAVCSPWIAGIISTEPGVMLGSPTTTPHSLLTTYHSQALLALIGIVPVKVTGESGPIEIGDLLVSSSTPGHAMRWSGTEPCPCPLVGKALEPCAGERGTIFVLLTAH